MILPMKIQWKHSQLSGITRCQRFQLYQGTASTNSLVILSGKHTGTIPMGLTIILLGSLKVPSIISITQISKVYLVIVLHPNTFYNQICRWIICRYVPKEKRKKRLWEINWLHEGKKCGVLDYGTILWSESFFISVHVKYRSFSFESVSFLLLTMARYASKGFRLA